MALYPSSIIAIITTYMAFYAVNGQAPAPAPSGPDCMSALLNVTDCLTYVEAGSNLTVPDKPCCPELAGLVESNPVCLCEFLAGTAESYGIKVDDSRALALPKVCHINTPPVSLCSAIGIPVNLGPSLAPMGGGPSPSSGEPLLPGSSSTPVTSPPKSNHGGRGFISVNLVILSCLSFVTAAIGIF